MASNRSEALHYHNVSQQFFYILQGVATFILDNQTYEVKAHQGIHITPKQSHIVKNKTKETLEFLVISQPSVQGDRIDIAH